MSEKINSTQRALRILKALKGRSLTGLSNKELADRLNESPVNITRALQALIAEGLVVKLEETGRFALGIQMLQIAVTHQRDTEKNASSNGRNGSACKCWGILKRSPATVLTNVEQN